MKGTQMARRFAWGAMGHAILLVIFFWWTGLAVGTPAQVALVLGVGVAWLVLAAWIESRIFAGAQWNALGRPRFWLALLFVAGAVATGRAITGWIPNVSGVGWQVTSAALRFLLAWLLIHAAWAALAWQAAAPPGEDALAAVPGE